MAKKECIPCKGKENKKPCTKCLSEKQKEDFLKLVDRKDQSKLSEKQKALVIEVANDLLGVGLKYSKYADVESYQLWINKVVVKIG